MARPRRRGEGGWVAGAESLPFGVLVFVSFTLLIVNAWAAVDARMTATSAAREYLRAYTEARNLPEARSHGERAAQQVMTAHDRRASSLTITPPTDAFGPCQRATVTVTLQVPAIRAPFVGSIGSSRVTATASELTDPYRSGGDVAKDALAGTECDG